MRDQQQREIARQMTAAYWPGWLIMWGSWSRRYHAIGSCNPSMPVLLAEYDPNDLLEAMAAAELHSQTRRASPAPLRAGDLDGSGEGVGKRAAAPSPGRAPVPKSASGPTGALSPTVTRPARAPGAPAGPQPRRGPQGGSNEYQHVA